MGPGPSSIPPTVYWALAQPCLGHLDPRFVQLMDVTQERLRYAFQTKNQLTFAVSGPGSAGMEACLVALLEPGSRFLVGVNGVFGARMADCARRAGADVHKLEKPWGQVFEPEEIRQAARQIQPEVIAVVHAETSTGARQPLEALGAIAREVGALLVVDTVTSVGGIPVFVDKWGIDASFSGSQKCLSCPPGLSPVTFSEKARERVRRRKHEIQSWFLDVSAVERYWGSERIYHHTAPVAMNYALAEALRLLCLEGLGARWKRHQTVSEALGKGLEKLGIGFLVPPEHRLPQLAAVTVPQGTDDAAIRKRLLAEFNIEIGGGLGEFKGKVWRIGLMGHGATMENVERLLNALKICLGDSKGR
jgi:alanine-glyoxylate transaminase/serine-glyoxylate transaminase/serine-pyruvate transaminase